MSKKRIIIYLCILVFIFTYGFISVNRIIKNQNQIISMISTQSSQVYSEVLRSFDTFRDEFQFLIEEEASFATFEKSEIVFEEVVDQMIPVKMTVVPKIYTPESKLYFVEQDGKFSKIEGTYVNGGYTCVVNVPRSQGTLNPVAMYEQEGITYNRILPVIDVTCDLGLNTMGSIRANHSKGKITLMGGFEFAYTPFYGMDYEKEPKVFPVSGVLKIYKNNTVIYEKAYFSAENSEHYATTHNYELEAQDIEMRDSDVIRVDFEATDNLNDKTSWVLFETP